MNEIEKLFRKISGKDRTALQSFVEKVLNKEIGLNIKRLSNSDLYRARKGRFRIIFHYNEKKEAIIDSIQLRNENTYKGL